MAPRGGMVPHMGMALREVPVAAVRHDPAGIRAGEVVAPGVVVSRTGKLHYLVYALRYRWLASTAGPESPQAQAARGRMNAALRRVPATNDKSPAAIAAHRALGRAGYCNKGSRKATGQSA